MNDFGNQSSCSWRVPSSSPWWRTPFWAHTDPIYDLSFVLGLRRAEVTNTPPPTTISASPTRNFSLSSPANSIRYP
jgi:hypothetical protein